MCRVNSFLHTLILVLFSWENTPIWVLFVFSAHCSLVTTLIHFLLTITIFLWVASLFGNKFPLAFSVNWTINLTFSILLLEVLSLYSHEFFFCLFQSG